MNMIRKIDLHMHTNVSDGTDTPEEIIDEVRSAGLDLFSVTDHDGIEACDKIRGILTRADPAFINGVEFSCRDKLGKYHILGYGYDPDAAAIRSIVADGHAKRVEKLGQRLQTLKEKFNIEFSLEEISALCLPSDQGRTSGEGTN